MGLEGVKNIARPLLKGGTEDKLVVERGVKSFINFGSLSKETTFKSCRFELFKRLNLLRGTAD